MLKRPIAYILVMLVVSLSAASLVSADVFAKNAAPPPAAQTVGGQCAAISAYVGRLGDGLTDLGAGIVQPDEQRGTEAIGTADCPSAAATKCDKLRLVAFMLALTDMTPQTYRRPGMSSFLANAEAEYAGMGDGCSAERWGYGGKAVRANFSSLTKVFCDPISREYANGQLAQMVLPGGGCDTSDAALTRLRSVLLAQAPASIAKRPEYLAGYAPIVARMYQYTNGAKSDEAAFRYRGRGYIQITGVDNYRQCQDDMMQARIHLERGGRVAAVNAATGLDWRTADVMREPELVSRNRFVAAFCAASYWHRKVTTAELVGGEAAAKERFRMMVKKINAHPDKFTERYPKYVDWCATVRCASNVPRQLNFERGFGLITGRALGRSAS